MKAFIAGVALAALASGMAMAAPAKRQPKSPASPVEMFHGEVDIRRQSRVFQPDPAKLVDGSFGYTSWDKWLDPADLPLDLRNRSVSLAAYLAVEVTEAGKVAGCRLLKSSSYADFDALACKAVMEKGSFDPFYREPGKPLAQTLNLSVRWRNVLHSEWEKQGRMLTPPAPPPPPAPDKSGWPRRSTSGQVHITSFPVLAEHVPAKVKSKGITSLDVQIDPAQGITGCKVGVSSGQAVLDEAACTVATKLPLSYGQLGCDWCRPDVLPLQFVWAGKKSHIRVPLQIDYAARAGWMPLPRDPADDRPATTYKSNGALISFLASDKDLKGLADTGITRDRISMRANYSPAGRATDCRVISSSGNIGFDTLMCDLVMKRARFAPRQDVFGSPIADSQFIVLKLDPFKTLTRRPPG